MSRSIYCSCINGYRVKHLCDCDKQPYYWKQGIGRTVALPIEEPDICEPVFDVTFDSTFGCTEEAVGIFDETFDITFN